MTVSEVFKGVVYKTTNTVNRKIYVGKDLTNRPNYLGSGKLLRLAFSKYGYHNFHKEILEHCVSLEHLNERERFWITDLRSQSKDVGYNIAKGGSGGDTFTHNPNKEAIRQKHKSSNSRLGHKHSAETRRQMSIDRKGRKLSVKHRLALSESAKGKKWKMSAKGVENIRLSQLGRKASEETKLKMSRTKLGVKRKQTKTDIQKIRNALFRLRVVFCCNTYVNVYDVLSKNEIEAVDLLEQIIDTANTQTYFIKQGLTLELITVDRQLLVLAAEFITSKMLTVKL